MNSMKFPKAVFFDLDGTILDTENLYLKLMLEYNKSKRIFISKKFYINNFLGKSKKIISAIMKECFDEKYDEYTYWDGLLKYRENYIKNHKIIIKKGFYELVDFLKLKNCYIGIVTSNSIELVKLLLEKSDVDINIFDSIVYRENVKRIKPYPDLYEFAIKKSGLNINDIVVLEDSNVGIMSALEANINVIYIKDISNVDKKLQQKCIACCNSMHDVIKFYNSGGIYGNN